MEALTSRRSQSTRVGHTNSFRRRITRLGQSRSSASTQRHLTSATEHERALTTRELALRAVAMVGDDRQDRNPQRQRHHARVSPQESPSNRAAGSWRVVVTTSRHVPHSAAPQVQRRTVRTVIDREAARRQARRHDARPHGPHRPRRDGRSVFRTSGQPRVDSTTTGHRCWSTRGYHAWTKKITVRAAGSEANANEQCGPARASPAARRWTGRRSAACDRPTAGTSGCS